MQALKALVIGMAVLIVIGMVVVIVTIANRLGKGRAPAAPAAVAAVAASLELPAGCSVAEMAAAGERLALRLAGTGDCRQILLVDPASGALVGRLRLAEAPAAQ